MRRIYRQGDVLLIQHDQPVPNAAELIPPEQPGRVILAHGEATGHAHALSTKHASMYRWEGERLLTVADGGLLVHEEHTHIPLPAGNYRVIQQVEYTPASIRAVAD